MTFVRGPLLVTIWLAVGLPIGHAAEVTLEPSKDNTIFEDNDNSSNGQGDSLFSGATANRNAQLIRRALLAFDVLGSVPNGATVTDVSLSLQVTKVPPSQVTNTMGLHRVTQDWGEGSSNAPGQEGRGTNGSAGDATWASSIMGTSTWTAPGGDFVLEPSASADVGGRGAYQWTSTELLADVQSWLDAPDTNFGWILIGDESRAKTAKRFGSGENSNATNRPQLTISFDLATLEGDFDADGLLAVSDIDSICDAITGGDNPATFDLDNNGVVDADDLTFWVENLAGSLIGDADLDGTVAFPDFLALSATFGQDGNWSQGDFNCDGSVTFPDFLALSANFGASGQQQGATLSSVPEPSGPLLWTAVLLILSLRRRRLFFVSLCD